MKNELAKEMSLTDLQVSSSYVEDGELCILVSRKSKEHSASSEDSGASDREPRWRIVADPETRAIREVQFFVSTDEGFEYPDYKPTEEQMEIFKCFAENESIGE